MIRDMHRYSKRRGEQFAEACEKEGVSQAAQLTNIMTEFVEKVRKNNS